MSRRPKDPGDQFSFADLAIGSAMTKRNVQLLVDQGLVPRGEDIRAFKRAATISAFVAAGVPLLLAGRLALGILDEFNQYDGEVPTGLSHLLMDLPAKAFDTIPSTYNDYWLHRALFGYPEVYPRGRAISSDALIEVIDRRFVFSATKSGLKTLVARRSVDAPFIGWIEGWDRGESASFVPVYERIGTMDDAHNPEWRETADRFEVAAQEARENAIGSLVVNVSLAVRTALDRLADHRSLDRGQS